MPYYNHDSALRWFAVLLREILVGGRKIDPTSVYLSPTDRKRLADALSKAVGQMRFDTMLRSVDGFLMRRAGPKRSELEYAMPPMSPYPFRSSSWYCSCHLSM